jgi:membrane associated rhomboid family serine protease
MGNIGVAGILLIAANVLFSYRGFKNHTFFNAYKFEIDPILVRKDYKRLITSGFLHVDWIHLFFNMYTLYAFSGVLETFLGWPIFLVIYFASLIGGDLLALFIHRNHHHYSAVGASGAVSGVIFATIALFPHAELRVFFIPMPSWLFGILFVAGSMYGIKSKRDNIGHDAHLGGALIGMLVAILFMPQVLQVNYIPILAIVVPTILFIVILATKPHLLLIDTSKKQSEFMKNYNQDQRFNAERNQRQQEVDRILDKINRTGAGSLSEKEKETLKNHVR